MNDDRNAWDRFVDTAYTVSIKVFSRVFDLFWSGLVEVAIFVGGFALVIGTAAIIIALAVKFFTWLF